MVKTKRTKQIGLRLPCGWASVVNEGETVSTDRDCSDSAGKVELCPKE